MATKSRASQPDRKAAIGHYAKVALTDRVTGDLPNCLPFLYLQFRTPVLRMVPLWSGALIARYPLEIILGAALRTAGPSSLIQTAFIERLNPLAPRWGVAPEQV